MDFGKLAQKAKAVVDKNSDKIAAGVDKATDFVDKKTKGKLHDKLEKVDNLASKLDKSGAKTGDDVAAGAEVDAGDEVTDDVAADPDTTDPDTTDEVTADQDATDEVGAGDEAVTAEEVGTGEVPPAD